MRKWRCALLSLMTVCVVATAAACQDGSVKVPYKIGVDQRSAGAPFDKELPVSEVITSAAQLKEACRLKEQSGSDDAGALEYWGEEIEQYDDEYFLDNSIILLIIPSSSGSYNYTMDPLRKKDGLLTVTVKRQKPGRNQMMTQDIAYFWYFVEVSKRDMEGVSVNANIIEL